MSRKLREPRTEIAEASFKPALLRTESRQDYEQFRQRMFNVFQPSDFLEELIVDDLTQAFWEVNRIRRVGPTLIENDFPVAVQILVSRSDDAFMADMMIKKESGEADRKELLQKQLNKVGLDEHSAEAEAFRLNKEIFLLIDRLLCSAESRKYRILQILSEYRAARARPDRSSVKPIGLPDHSPVLVENPLSP